MIENISVVLPAKNEEQSVKGVITGILQFLPGAEVILVDDGSTDTTAVLAAEAGAQVVSHPYSKGNGAAIKTGARAATGDIIVFMDADGQHNPADIPKLLHKLCDEEYDMAVGARQGLRSQASIARGGANKIYNKLASMMVGREVEDLTSGFRAVKASKFREFLCLLPNGFSYPTTSTMAFFRAGYSLAYVPIVTNNRVGKSHINLLKDGIRFLLIIFRIGALYSPLKVFFPVSVAFFLFGLVNYGYTYFTEGRFTNMSAMFFLSAMMVFMMGLIAEQITMLLYKDSAE